jgi:hypothetical protein
MEITDHDPARYKAGEVVKIPLRFPIGHYRVPMYMRDKQVKIIKNLGRYINPEQEAFGKNAGDKLWYYLVTIPQKELWSDYKGPETDQLNIEVFEPWLENI